MYESIDDAELKFNEIIHQLPRIVTIAKDFTFHSAHYLPPGINPKCCNLHGHTYTGRLYLRGRTSDSGILVEATLLKQSIDSVINLIDHAIITQFNSGKKPTSINRWEYELIQPLFDAGHKVYSYPYPSTVENLCRHLAYHFIMKITERPQLEGVGKCWLWVELWETPTFSAITSEIPFETWEENNA